MTLRVGAIQMACSPDRDGNVRRAVAFVRAAAGQGARLILLPELFETPYFCKDQDPAHFDLARPRQDNPTLKIFADLAAELAVVLPISFFEVANRAYYNSLVVIDADGGECGLYRKSHIPDGPGYQEKFYFSPGDTGFRVFATRHAKLGIAICWDQWFPEAARAMALQGAELLLYPTAIGSEPQDATLDSSGHWQRVMQGHAAANVTPLIAANRIGLERGRSAEITFYGSSFIAGPTGEMLTVASRDREEILTADLDLAAIAAQRRAWGVFRDRRPDLYGTLSTLDGTDSAAR
jgi:N-carbamoylputrescine amidase